MKKAYLVDINICTRIVIDEDGLKKAVDKFAKNTTLEEQRDLLLFQLAYEKICKDLSGYIVQDNMEVTEDLECPYKPFDFIEPVEVDNDSN